MFQSLYYNRSLFKGQNITNYNYLTFYDFVFKEDLKQSINMNLFYGRIPSLYADAFDVQDPWDLPDLLNDDDPLGTIPDDDINMYFDFWLGNST